MLVREVDTLESVYIFEVNIEASIAILGIKCPLLDDNCLSVNFSVRESRDSILS